MNLSRLKRLKTCVKLLSFVFRLSHHIDEAVLNAFVILCVNAGLGGPPRYHADEPPADKAVC